MTAIDKQFPTSYCIVFYHEPVNHTTWKTRRCFMHGSIWPCPRIIQLFITLFWARSFKDFIELRWVLRGLVYNVMYVRCTSLYSVAEFVSDIALVMKNYFKILVKRANLHVTFYSFCSNGPLLTWPETKQKKGFGKVIRKAAGCRIFVKKSRNAGSRQVVP